MANFYGNDIQKVKNVTVVPNLPYTKFLTVFNKLMLSEYLQRIFGAMIIWFKKTFKNKFIFITKSIK